jgi:hypothetical protein
MLPPNATTANHTPTWVATDGYPLERGRQTRWRWRRRWSEKSRAEKYAFIQSQVLFWGLYLVAMYRGTGVAQAELMPSVRLRNST